MMTSISWEQLTTTVQVKTLCGLRSARWDGLVATAVEWQRFGSEQRRGGTQGVIGSIDEDLGRGHRWLDLVNLGEFRESLSMRGAHFHRLYKGLQFNIAQMWWFTIMNNSLIYQSWSMISIQLERLAGIWTSSYSIWDGSNHHGHVRCWGIPFGGGSYQVLRCTIWILVGSGSMHLLAARSWKIHPRTTKHSYPNVYFIYFSLFLFIYMSKEHFKNIKRPCTCTYL